MALGGLQAEKPSILPKRKKEVTQGKTISSKDPYFLERKGMSYGRPKNTGSEGGPLTTF